MSQQLMIGGVIDKDEDLLNLSEFVALDISEWRNRILLAGPNWLEHKSEFDLV